MEEKKYYLTGIEYMKLGNYLSAYEVFTEAIENYPQNADFYSERGVARFHLNDLTGALADMNKAQELEPEKPYRYSSRAFIKDALKDTEGAIEDYKIAIKLDPEDDIAHNNLGLLQEKLGFSQMAQDHFETADQLAKTKTISRKLPDHVEIGSEGELLLESFKKELNLQVLEDDYLAQTVQKSKPNMLSIAFSVFRSSKARGEYIRYIRNILKV